MFFLWAFWVLLLIGGLATFIVHRVRVSRGTDPIAILKSRYARGEIDSDTYHRMLDDLRPSAAH